MIAEQQNTPTSAERARWKSKAEQLRDVLANGPRTSQELVELCGHRFSASIHKLREQGYVIERSETSRGECLWVLTGLRNLVEVTDAMKEAYYGSEHWKTTRAARVGFDRGQCVLCGVRFDLEVHHWRYDLFGEKQCDLSTLCHACHVEIHDNPNVSIHFPHYVTPAIAARLQVEANHVQA